MRQSSARALVLLATLAVASRAHAQQAGALEAAKELFRQGVAAVRAGNLQAAADALLRSHALYPSEHNTINAAIVLERLGRYDEASDLYEEALARYAAALSQGDITTVPSTLRRLAQKTATLDIAADATGSVVIDGRERGKLPLRAPLRVMPGGHRVRILKDGYAAFQVDVTVAAGERRAIDAHLVPLAAAGGLRVEVPGSPGAEVTVDGVGVGQAPWEGTLAPGAHVISAAKDDVGSPPTQARVLQGQTTLLRLRAGPLGPTARVVADPPSADLTLDGIPLGRGEWAGALPVGNYEMSATQDGYRPARARLVVARGSAPPRATLKLAVDPEHPRWARPWTGHVIASLSGSWALAASLGSEVEVRCETGCAPDRHAQGPFAMLTAGYELPFHLSFEIMGGYLSLQRNVRRGLRDTFPRDQPAATVTYEAQDDLLFRGFTLGALVGHRLHLLGAWELRSRAGVGVVFARASDTVSVQASSNGETSPAGFGRAPDGEVASSAPFFHGELGLAMAVGHARIGAALGTVAILQGAPQPIERGAVAVPSKCHDRPLALGCAPAFAGFARERPYGPFFAATPRVYVEVVF